MEQHELDGQMLFHLGKYNLFVGYNITPNKPLSHPLSLSLPPLHFALFKFKYLVLSNIQQTLLNPRVIHRLSFWSSMYGTHT